MGVRSAVVAVLAGALMAAGCSMPAAQGSPTPNHESGSGDACGSLTCQERDTLVESCQSRIACESLHVSMKELLHDDGDLERCEDLIEADVLDAPF